MRFRTLSAVLLASLSLIGSTKAQTADVPASTSPPLRIATTETEPFVYKTATGEWTGFDIELAQAICEELQTTCIFENYESFPELLKAVQDRKTDAAISSISITSARSKTMDFSTPYYNSGLMILTRDDSSKPVGLASSVSGLFRKDLPNYWEQSKNGVFLLLLGGMILFAVWFCLRNSKSENVKEGVLSAVRLYVVFALVFVVAKTTSTMTADRFLYEISQPGDLRGKDVATVAGTTSVGILKEKGAKLHLVTDISDAYAMLEAGQVEAIVYDAPTLQWYSRTDGAGKVAAVGSVFAQQGYGIALPEGSPLRNQINQAILKLKENGVYDRIHERYFGVE